MEHKTTIENIDEALKQCDLCKERITVIYPDDEKYWFLSYEELIREFHLKEKLEANIKQHGGYMIDEWEFVDERQQPMDLRNCITLDTEE